MIVETSGFLAAVQHAPLTLRPPLSNGLLPWRDCAGGVAVPF